MSSPSQQQFITFNFPGVEENNVWFLPVRWQPKRALGAGAFGQVMECTDTETGTNVAIKRIFSIFDEWEDGLGEIREIKAMMHLDHPKIIGLKDLLVPYHVETEVSLDGQYNDIYLVMEKKASDIQKVIENTRLSEQHVSFIMFQLMDGLKYMHAAHIVHRDLKPENLLVDAQCNISIIDLGLARELEVDEEKKDEQSFSEYVMTRWYRAPEIMLAERPKYDFAIDVWSAGCLFYELLTQEALFPGSNESKMIELINICIFDPDGYLRTSAAENPRLDFADLSNAATRTTLEEKLSQYTSNADLIDLMTKMLTIDPSKRISAADSLEHPFFANWAELKSSSQANPFSFQKPRRPSDGSEKDLLRDMVWECIQSFHSDLAPRPRN